MAPSFTTVKILASFVKAELSNCLTIRRGYAMASEGAVWMSKSKMAEKSEEEKVSNEKDCSWWMPDSVTGYYKPHNINEIDAAELRAKLLSKKFNNSSL